MPLAGKAMAIYALAALTFFGPWPDSYPLRAQTIVVLEESACLYLEKGDIDEALRLLQQALEVNPDNLNALLYFGIALYLKNDLPASSSNHCRSGGKRLSVSGKRGY